MIAVAINLYDSTILSACSTQSKQSGINLPEKLLYELFLIYFCKFGLSSWKEILCIPPCSLYNKESPNDCMNPCKTSVGLNCPSFKDG